MDFRKIIENTVVPMNFSTEKKLLVMMALLDMLIVFYQINYIVLELALKEV